MFFFVSIPEAFKASGIELSPPPGSSGKIVSVRDKFARIVSVRDIFCGGATKLSLADTNFVSRSETCFSGAGAKIRKRQKKDILKNPFKTIKDGQDDISAFEKFHWDSEARWLIRGSGI